MTEVPTANNRPEEILKRRLQDTLIVSGLAVMVFGIWDLVRSILLVSLQLRPMLDTMAADAASEEEAELLRQAVEHIGLLTAIILGIVLAFGLIGLILHIYVGRSARAVGFGRIGIRKKWVFFTLLLAVLNGLSLITMAMSWNSYVETESILDFIITLIVTASSLYATLELTISAFRYKKLLEVQDDREAAV